MMFRNSSLAAVLVLGIGTAPLAYAGDTPPAAAVAKPAFSTSDSDIGTLLGNSQTKAVLDKHIPEFAGNPQIEMARAMTLRQIQSFASDMLTDEVLAKIDADLAKVPEAN